MFGGNGLIRKRVWCYKKEITVEPNVNIFFNNNNILFKHLLQPAS